MRKIYYAPILVTAPDPWVCLQVTNIISALEKNVLPKLRSLESSLRPINRLPKDVFVLIPLFLMGGEQDDQFAMNKPLITMTHVCRSWRSTLISTPSLWTHIDFSTFESKQAMGFLSRSWDQLLEVYQHLENDEDMEPFRSTTLCNLYRLQRLEITTLTPNLERVLMRRFTRPAPVLEHLQINNDIEWTGSDMKLHNTIFEGHFPKLLSLTLHNFRMDFHTFNFPSLTRFTFKTKTETSAQDLASFFELCGSLEFIKLSLTFTPQTPAPPPRERVRLAALKEVRFDKGASACGLLDQLILPKCEEMMLKGQFTDEEFDEHGRPAARIHPSSVDHLPLTRGITKAVVMPRSCVLSGPNGCLRFWFSRGCRGNFDAGYFSSLSPISISEIEELLVGNKNKLSSGVHKPWEQTAIRVRGAFEVLTQVEDLTIVNCETGPFFAALGSTADSNVLLPELRRLTIYVGSGYLDVAALIQCAGARFEHSRSLGEVTIVFEEQPKAGTIRKVESLGKFVGELNYRVGAIPELKWDSNLKDGDTC